MSWRRLEPGDLRAVKDLADRVHVGLPEDLEIFEERARLYGGGCLVCVHGQRLVGYAITHPWARDDVPPLNSLLGRLPAAGGTYYVHDVALDPAARGHGLGAQAMEHLTAHAARSGFRTMGLVAVSGSAGFWERQGFRRKDLPALRSTLLTYGADAAYMECAIV